MMRMLLISVVVLLAAGLPVVRGDPVSDALKTAALNCISSHASAVS